MSYLLQAKQAVERLHKCTAVHVETVRVRHTSAKEVIWDADVEVFALDGFNGGDCCYVWGFENQTEAGKLEFVSVPATRNLTTPSAAVLAVVEWEKRHARGPLPIPPARNRITQDAPSVPPKV